jgi:hypothetical protein
MGELDRTITVDPIVVNGQVVGDGSVITGKKTPLVPPSWWPWIIAAGAIGFVWWQSQQEEGDDDDRPFDDE